MRLMKEFFAILPNELNMLFYGIDIIVDVRDGTHYIVDCNYHGNYADIPMPELIREFDILLRE